MKILVINFFIQNYTGSEINALQLCEGLRNLGHQAEVGALIIKTPLSELAVFKEINLINLLEERPAGYDYDLIWAHHAPALAHLLFKREVANTRIIFSSLSSLVPLEAPPIFFKDIHYFISHNPVNSLVLVRAGVPVERIHYFPNTAPRRFFEQARQTHQPTPKRVAVISNHPTEELRGFARLASQDGCRVEFIGEADRPQFVDEVVLSRYDLVITIGKTVQYCFALNIPVYVYDHFGGPGYITPQTFDLARMHNFSGKGFEIRYSSDGLYEDIFNRYPQNLSHLDFLHAESQRLFCLETNLQAVLADVPGIPVTDIRLFREKNLLSERTYDISLSLLRDIFSLQNDLAAKNRQIQRLSESYENQFGWRLTHPAQVLKSSRLVRWLKTAAARGDRKLRQRLTASQQEHYLTLIQSSALFDADWYLKKNPDIAASAVDPARHYLLHGGFEGRDPGPYFSSARYLQENPQARVKRLNPLVHYLLNHPTG